MAKIYVGNLPQQYDYESSGGFYRHWGNGYIVEHQEGSVEEVSNWVASGQTEIGIVYIAQRQLAAFRHILGHKNLEFEPLDVKEACVYVGPNHPYYERDCVDFRNCPACASSGRYGITFLWSTIWTGSHWVLSAPKI